jgi:hypothetical protein
MVYFLKNRHTETFRERGFDFATSIDLEIVRDNRRRQKWIRSYLAVKSMEVSETSSSSDLTGKVFLSGG